MKLQDNQIHIISKNVSGDEIMKMLKIVKDESFDEMGALLILPFWHREY